jgi:hypothetical protein
MTMNPRSRFLYELRIAFTSIALYGVAIPPKSAYSAAMPQAHPAIRRRYSVLVKRQGGSRSGRHGRGTFAACQITSRSSSKGMASLLESLSEEKPNA